MKPTLLAAALALLATGASLDAATATASIGVTILGTGGTDPAASAATLSAAQPFTNDGRGRVAGSFSVAGARRAAYAVVVPSQIHASGTGGDIVVHPSEPGARFLPASGRGEMHLGFEPEAAARPAAGLYTGTVAVTLAYN